MNLEKLLFGKAPSEKQKKTAFALSVTFIALALALTVLLVSVIVDIATGGDNTPPEIIPIGGSVINVNTNSTISYYDKVNVSDDSGEECTLEVINSTVDTSVAGSYTVTYKATDKAGNSSTLTLKVVVTEPDPQLDALMAKIATLSGKLGITESMSTEDKVKAIFKYTNSPGVGREDSTILFVEHSNIKSIDRDDWKTDWVEEANLTLMSMQGDCYSYYSVSKAFFTYWKIPHKDVKQQETEDGSTHFWSMVNIGTDASPRWYFYDSTRLAKAFPNGGSGCLFTESQRSDYNSMVKPGFYAFDSSGYPNTSAEVINTKYDW